MSIAVDNLLWAKAIDLLDAFIREHGHALVPPDYVTVEGWRLGRFLLEARRAAFGGALDLDRPTAARLAGWPDDDVTAIFGDSGRAA